MTTSSDTAALRDQLAGLRADLSGGGSVSEQLLRHLDRRLAAFEGRLARQLEDRLAEVITGAVSAAFGAVLPDTLRPAGQALIPALAPSLAGSVLSAVLPAFADGGIIDGPSLIGLAGEAGPEAVLPLSRGADGRLGVSVTGADGAGPPPVVLILRDRRSAGDADTAAFSDLGPERGPEPDSDLISELTGALGAELTTDRFDRLAGALEQAVGAAVATHLSALLDDARQTGSGGTGGAL